MASYQGDRAVHAKTLVAATVDTVTLSRKAKRVEVLNHDGAAAIYFTVDGSTPTVAGDNTYGIPATPSALEVEIEDSDPPTTVKLISAGTPTYSVTAS